MSKYDKLLQKVLGGTSDKNISFEELCNLLNTLGFVKRTKGGHHIFSREGVEEIINLQPVGSAAKAYQVKQVRTIIVKYKLSKSHE